MGSGGVTKASGRHRWFQSQRRAVVLVSRFFIASVLVVAWLCQPASARFASHASGFVRDAPSYDVAVPRLAHIPLATQAAAPSPTAKFAHGGTLDAVLSDLVVASDYENARCACLVVAPGISKRAYANSARGPPPA